MVIKQKLN